MEQLRQLIRQEDPLRPLTDAELAQRLAVRRETVTEWRHRDGIPDSHDRRRAALAERVRAELAQNPRVSARAIAARLSRQGVAVSAATLAELLREARAGADPHEAAPATPPVPAGFEDLVGADGSLAQAVALAQAAVHYPPHGLHTLIVGPTGAGKSELAAAMHRSLTQKRGPVPFVPFSCADYAENPQFLLSQLFGHVKGAFTGADQTQPGHVDHADGGILFLDEVHRLPPEGQELLFMLIDQRRYRRLGEVGTIRTADVMLIAATSEDPDSHLLATLRRRIPVVIELPPLDQRPLEERLTAIETFLHKEAVRLRSVLDVSPECIRTLLNYRCPGNLGSLRSDIQLTCARALARQRQPDGGPVTLHIEPEDLPATVRRAPGPPAAVPEVVESLLTGRWRIVPGVGDRTHAGGGPLEDIYRTIDNQRAALQAAGMRSPEVEALLASDLEDRLWRLMARVRGRSRILRDELPPLLPRGVDEAAQAIVREAAVLGPLDPALYYWLALHLSASVRRVKEGKALRNPRLEAIRNDYPTEYALAARLVRHLSETLAPLPEDEAGFVALYIRAARTSDRAGRRQPTVILISYTPLVQGLQAVARHLRCGGNVSWCAVPLDAGPDEAEQIIVTHLSAFAAVDRPLVLLDPSLARLLPAVRRALPRAAVVHRADSAVLTEIEEQLSAGNLDPTSLGATVPAGPGAAGPPVPAPTAPAGDPRLRPAILAVCLTGEGTAALVRTLLRQALAAHPEVEVLAVAALGEALEVRVAELGRRYRVLAACGTVDPELPGVPFVPVAELLDGSGLAAVRRLLPGEPATPDLARLFDPQLTFARPPWTDKPVILNQLAAAMQSRGRVDSSFINGILDREQFGPTVLEAGIAIPHAINPVIHAPAIATAVLPSPVAWHPAGAPVDLVFMLALDVRTAPVYRRLNRLFGSARFRDSLRACTSDQDLYLQLLQWSGAEAEMP